MTNLTSPPAECSIEGCEGAVFARGWCSKHYTRWQRHGDPLKTTRQSPSTRNATEKHCPRCGNSKPIGEFGRRSNGNPKGYCRDCEARYQRQYAESTTGRESRGRASSKWSAKNHAYFLNYRYGITAEQYDTMLAHQGGVCAICGASEPGGKARVWHVDHCHTSNRVRGLLCGPCNRGLGQFRDDIDRLKTAVRYLEVNRQPSRTGEST